MVTRTRFYLTLIRKLSVCLLIIFACSICVIISIPLSYFSQLKWSTVTHILTILIKKGVYKQSRWQEYRNIKAYNYEAWSHVNIGLFPEKSDALGKIWFLIFLGRSWTKSEIKCWKRIEYLRSSKGY